MKESFFVFPFLTENTSEFSLVFPISTGNTNGLASGLIHRPFYFATQAFKPWMTADENPACSIAFNPRMV